MKQITLRKLEDGSVFKRFEQSKITYTLIMKEKGGVIFTSN